MSDVFDETLREATLAVLLGSTTLPIDRVLDEFGNTTHWNTATIGSAFADRVRQKAYGGDYDDLIRRVMEQVDPSNVARHVEVKLSELLIAGLGVERYRYGQDKDNWLQTEAKRIAVEACTVALSADEALLDTLRAKIGSEVDRNRVGINITLSDPER